ncbi:hypothetical protein SLEP1_g34985 [Rubroshorea leprosula]|uniref:Uncharacterized protein n=1 Tax=Rubroshorea leprosula TaxID=152421 RepID=A0AAV5KLS9_9ROSI|nr:hypothetical protein SLEP1_g34985 [Rubroshorea leprosula]
MLGVGSLFALISLFHILWIHRRFSKRYMDTFPYIFGIGK